MNYLPALKFNLPMRREETNIQNYQYFHKLHNKPRLRFHGDRRDVFKRYRIKNYKILSRSCQPFSFKKPSRSPFLFFFGYFLSTIPPPPPRKFQFFSASLSVKVVGHRLPFPHVSLLFSLVSVYLSYPWPSDEFVRVNVK